DGRAGLPATLGRAIAIWLEERQMGAGDRVHDRRPPRLLGRTGLSQQRRPMARAALFLPGTTRRGPGAVALKYPARARSCGAEMPGESQQPWARCERHKPLKTPTFSVMTVPFGWSPVGV